MSSFCKWGKMEYLSHTGFYSSAAAPVLMSLSQVSWAAHVGSAQMVPAQGRGHSLAVVVPRQEGCCSMSWSRHVPEHIPHSQSEKEIQIDMVLENTLYIGLSVIPALCSNLPFTS